MAGPGRARRGGGGGGARGRGGGRGGGGGRGRGRGRGGARGRATSRYGPRSRFESQRLAEKENPDDEDDLSSSEDDFEDQEMLDDSGDDESEDDDQDAKASAQPYLTLLQSLAAADTSNGPRAKKRKLHHDREEEPLESSKASPEISEPEQEQDNEADDADLAEDVDEDAADATDDILLGQDSDSEDEQDSTDPFDVHFAHSDESLVASRIGAIKQKGWESKRVASTFPKVVATAPKDSGIFAKEAPVPLTKLGGLKLKQKLQEVASQKVMTTLTPVQQSLAPLMFDYQDILFCNRTTQNAESIRQLVCLHTLNHVFKTRDRVIKNNYKLAKEDNPELEFRDQGFTRPKVLFLLPTRQSCVRMINTICQLCEPDQQENRKRFDESFDEESDKFGDDKPSDFRELFGGNDDDMFRLGVKFTRKTIKYFSQFYSSDILFASPLGLRMAMGSEDDKKTGGKKSKQPDFDFLSSIEMVVADQADGLLMQNWEHVEYIFEHLNVQPKDAHGCDFSRVRNWYLEDWARYFRQTIVLSSFNTPELTELMRLHCHNWAGKLRIQPEHVSGAIQQLGVKARQTFSRLDAPAIDADPDARFAYFTNAIVPSLVRRARDATGTLIFIPSYLDFVRVRNYFATAPAVAALTFGALSEYADVPEASRARSHFTSGRHRVLLYTERAHHFRRYQIRGVHRVIFYALPDNPVFYTEIAGGYLARSEREGVVEAGKGQVRVLFSKYDVMKLERVVGAERAIKMVKERGDTFDFL